MPRGPRGTLTLAPQTLPGQTVLRCPVFFQAAWLGVTWDAERGRCRLRVLRAPPVERGEAPVYLVNFTQRECAEQAQAPTQGQHPICDLTPSVHRSVPQRGQIGNHAHVPEQ